MVKKAVMYFTVVWKLPQTFHINIASATFSAVDLIAILIQILVV